MPQPHSGSVRVTCAAMCGGLARWLRLLGVDTSYTPGIDDRALVEHALAEGRIVVSSDGKLFERRVLTSGQLRGVRVPVGPKLRDQVQFVVSALGVTPGFPRCTLCNGALAAVPRAEVADIVPARSLIWMDTFYRCSACGHVFWEGTHWQRIGALRDLLAAAPTPSAVDQLDADHASTGVDADPLRRQE